MGIFDKIFGSGSSTPGPTAEMMGEDRYWRLIADSLAAAGEDQEAQVAYLRRELGRLPVDEIVGFRLWTDKLLFDTYTPEMWCAGYIMNGGCSDDSFQYFRLWVISRGHDVYAGARRDPDSLHSVAHTPVPEGLFDLESLWYVADEAFQQKTGKDLHDHTADTFKFNEANYPDLQFNWTEEVPESRRKICPKLFERFSDGI